MNTAVRTSRRPTVLRSPRAWQRRVSQSRRAGRGGYLIVAAVALLALLPVVVPSAAAPVRPGLSTAAPWTRHPADYVTLPTVIACLLGRLLINR